MADTLWFRTYGDPVQSMSTHEFFDQNRTGVTRIVVWDVNEKEYWEGLQVITGHHYRVVTKAELLDLPPGQALLFATGSYYTYDPLDRSGN